ncbi:hypothetical protein AL062_02765 [Pseudomonas syringae pv. syringae]|uniref:hypothetical protein n=1 Tax=Pseudomonas syringae TaxID=317 RepID=UPI00076017CC|nr:hypothetical protein [Pseudomonas syringae]KWS20856.1 hypothetical protein AL062_02765 [Pseudomonas syringae pv. syringae]
MQAKHIIILVGIGVCFLLLTVFIERAIKRAIRRSYWASRFALGITEIRTESLHETRPEQAVAEGLVNGRGSWKPNSWGWVVVFKLVEETV